MRELDYGKTGMRIRQVRKARGWSQDELAKRCGISMSFLGHIERGTRIMSMETFVNICAALDAGADELLWGVAAPSEAVLDMWKQPQNGKEKTERRSGRKEEAAGTGKPDSRASAGKADSYAMYVKIMKSVAEIMNEA